MRTRTRALAGWLGALRAWSHVRSLGGQLGLGAGSARGHAGGGSMDRHVTICRVQHARSSSLFIQSSPPQRPCTTQLLKHGQVLRTSVGRAVGRPVAVGAPPALAPGEPPPPESSSLLSSPGSSPLISSPDLGWLRPPNAQPPAPAAVTVSRGSPAAPRHDRAAAGAATQARSGQQRSRAAGAGVGRPPGQDEVAGAGGAGALAQRHAALPPAGWRPAGAAGGGPACCGQRPTRCGRRQ